MLTLASIVIGAHISYLHKPPRNGASDAVHLSVERSF